MWLNWPMLGYSNCFQPTLLGYCFRPILMGPSLMWRSLPAVTLAVTDMTFPDVG